MEYHPLLGFITPYFLPTWHVIMAALLIFQTWIWMGVGMDKFLIDLSFSNILPKKLHGLGAC
jgi:hypothetical protein